MLQRNDLWSPLSNLCRVLVSQNSMKDMLFTTRYLERYLFIRDMAHSTGNLRDWGKSGKDNKVQKERIYVFPSVSVFSTQVYFPRNRVARGCTRESRNIAELFSSLKWKHLEKLGFIKVTLEILVKWQLTIWPVVIYFFVGSKFVYLVCLSVSTQLAMFSFRLFA